MNMNDTKEIEKRELPPLPDLPVVRDTYCSQEMTDNLVHFLQETRPDLLEGLAAKEKWANEEWKHADTHFQRAIHPITEYLREEVDQDKSQVIVPETRLGMLDFLYELSRRVRAALGLHQFLIMGKSFASGPEGPFPPFDSFIETLNPYERIGNDDLLREDVNAIVQGIYEKYPDIFYELSEQNRRLVHNYEIYGELNKLLQLNERAGLYGRINGWLSMMCERTPFKKYDGKDK